MTKQTALSFLCLVYFVSSHYVTAQNLAPNPGFEEHVSNPPGSPTGVNESVGWFRVGTTTDFFHRNFGPVAGVPYNIKGYQEPASGDGYAGIIAGRNVLEYLAVELAEPLEKDVLYEIGFKVNLANIAESTSDDVGMTFLDKNPLDIVETTNLNRASIYHLKRKEGQMITDTLGWESVEGSYLAKGGETFLVIGNFYLPHQTDIIPAEGSGFPLVYFYIDDVYVQACTAPMITKTWIDTTVCKGITTRLSGLSNAENYYWENLDVTQHIEVEKPGIFTLNNYFEECQNVQQIFNLKTTECNCMIQIPSVQAIDTPLKIISSLEVQSYRLQLFDARGRLVKSIVDSQLLEIELPPFSAVYFWRAELSCLSDLNDNIFKKMVGGKVIIMHH